MFFIRSCRSSGQSVAGLTQDPLVLVPKETEPLPIELQGPARVVAVGLTDFWTLFIYGSIILISISIHAILQRRFQR